MQIMYGFFLIYNNSELTHFIQIMKKKKKKKNY